MSSSIAQNIEALCQEQGIERDLVIEAMKVVHRDEGEVLNEVPGRIVGKEAAWRNQAHRHRWRQEPAFREALWERRRELWSDAIGANGSVIAYGS